VQAELPEVLIHVLVLAGGREPGVGFRVWDLGFGVWILCFVFWVLGLGFGV